MIFEPRIFTRTLKRFSYQVLVYFEKFPSIFVLLDQFG